MNQEHAFVLAAEKLLGIAGDRGIVGFAGNLVDFVYIDDAAPRTLNIVVGRLQQLEDDVLDVLADIAGFGERRRIGDGERNIENARPGQLRK